MQGGAQEKAALSGSAQAAEKSSSTSIISSAQDVDKRIATAKAELAMRGYQVHKTASDGWLVAKWDQSMYCSRVSDLEAFVRRVGGAQ